MKHYYLAAFGCLGLALAAAAGEGPGPLSAESQELYQQWTEAVTGIAVEPKAPLFLKLLGRPDADLALLNGLHHRKDPVRRLSRAGLAQLKTDRSFDVLVKALADPGMFVRERSLHALGAFAQPRCVPVLIKALKTDPEPQLRQGAAYVLQDYEGPEVVEALLTALQDQERVAVNAAFSLGKLNAEQAIQPTFGLVLRLKDHRLRDTALGGLRQQRHKATVPLLIELIERLPQIDKVWGKWMAEKLDGDLLAHAKKAEAALGPPPDTLEQWRDWWKKAEPLFTENMQLVPKPATAREYKPEEFGTRPEELAFAVSLDARSYPLGDPIRLDVSLRNGSKQPHRTILPRLPSPWWPTMAYGVRLERVGKEPKVLLDLAPSGDYQGSYSGPPPFGVLLPGETFRNSICLQHWLRGTRIWPLPEGQYALAVAFDSAQFPDVKPQGVERVHRWAAPAVQFAVAGPARADPKELLGVIGEKCSLPWLAADLTSRRPSRKQAARFAVWQYGDSRLVPQLRTLIGKEDLSRELPWGELRPFPPR